MTYPDSKHPDSRLIGECYQLLVAGALLHQYHIPLHYFWDKQSQYWVGESHERYEIKYDYLVTKNGRLSIEVGEKSSLNQGTFFPSGILRKDNTAYYAQGDKNCCYVFKKKDLCTHFRETKPYVIADDPPTIQKFYMSEVAATKLRVFELRLSKTHIKICDFSTAPMSETAKHWTNCLECPLQIELHCQSSGGRLFRFLQDNGFWELWDETWLSTHKLLHEQLIIGRKMDGMGLA